MKENADNEDFKYIIYFLLNPFITTGISNKKIEKPLNREMPSSISCDSFKELLKWIVSHNTGTDFDIKVVQTFICGQPFDMQEFYKSIITKSLRIGCDYKTVNKIWGEDFIPSFECMLAEKYFEYPDSVNGKNFTLTVKLDGIRCILIKENNTIELYSRQGKLIEGLKEIEDAARMCKGDFVLDGELLISNADKLLSKEQYKETTKIVRKDGDKKGIIYHVFDCLTVSEFKDHQSTLPYSSRRWVLKNVVRHCGSAIQILPMLYSGNEVSQIKKYLDIAQSSGQEGIMININDASYEFKRTKSLLKCKVMQDCDLKIVGFEEGKGRLKGTLGRLNVDYKGNVLGVGGGFSDEDRKFIWNNRASLMGRTVTVQYFEETQNKDGKLSLRFPVFKTIREEGKSVSYH